MATKPIVTRHSSDTGVDIWFDTPYPAGFCDITTTNPEFPANHWTAHYYHNLLVEIISRPTNLLAHVQRINLLRKNDGDSRDEEMLGAMQDLIIALDNKGRDLLRQLTAYVRPMLKSEDRRKLDSWSHDVSVAKTTRTAYSILSKDEHVSGNVIVSKKTTGQDISHGPLEEANEYLDHGQFLEARQVLELAVVASPARDDIRELLFKIYQSSRDSTNYKLTREKVLEKNPTVAGGWPEFAQLVDSSAASTLAHQSDCDGV